MTPQQFIEAQKELESVIEVLNHVQSFSVKLKQTEELLNARQQSLIDSERELQITHSALDNINNALAERKNKLDLQEASIATQQKSLESARIRLVEEKKEIESRKEAVVASEKLVQGRLKEVQLLNTKRKELEEKERAIERQVVIFREREAKLDAQESQNKREQQRLQRIADSLK